jgi:Ammonium Transporter Family
VTVLPLILAVQDTAASPPPPAIVAADTAWMLVSTALVLLMTPALAFFYGGLVRNKNSLNTMMMSFVALGVVGVTWALIAYSLAFSEGGPFLGGLANLGLAGVGTEAKGTIPHVLFMAYQGTFAIITAALISGAIVERMRFGPYVAFIAIWTLLVYAPVAHWVWGGGWLMSRGVLDFAGGTVVHINAGVSALVAAMVLGPRKDYGRQAVLPHNVPFVLLGAGLLWFGWFGFNGGSALAANELAALAFSNTFLAPMATLVVWTLLDYVRTGRATAVGAATGIVVGLVAITPAAGFVSPASALLLGVPQLFRHRAPLPYSGRRLPRRVRRPRGGRPHRRAADRRAGRKGLELGRERWPLLREPGPARGPGAGLPQRRPLRRDHDLPDPQGDGLRDCAPGRAPHRGRGHGREPARRRGLRQRRGLDPGAARGGDPVGHRAGAYPASGFALRRRP